MRQITFMLVLMSLIACHSSPPPQPAAAPRIREESSENRPRCGTPSLTDLQKLTVTNSARAFMSNQTLRDFIAEGFAVTLPIRFAVLHKKDGTGNVSDDALNLQVAKLNAAFASTGIQFAQKGIERHENDTWHNFCDSDMTTVDAKRKIITDKSSVYIFICNPMTVQHGAVLGYAWLPLQRDAGSVELEGIAVKHTSLPGGSQANYNLGATCVHEMGHYLGLQHTFEGGCIDPGDGIEDTPPEADASFHCEPRDSCRHDAHGDSIHNYMNYTPDACMTDFTPGQAARMRENLVLYHRSFKPINRISKIQVDSLDSLIKAVQNDAKSAANEGRSLR